MEKLRNSGTAHQWHCYFSACEGGKGPKSATCEAIGAIIIRNCLCGSFQQQLDSIQLTRLEEPLPGPISADSRSTKDQHLHLTQIHLKSLAHANCIFLTQNGIFSYTKTGAWIVGCFSSPLSMETVCVCISQETSNASLLATNKQLREMNNPYGSLETHVYSYSAGALASSLLVKKSWRTWTQ